MRIPEEQLIRRVAWREQAADLQAIRRAVFVVEQHVPEDEEWDDMDALSQHVLAMVQNIAVGTGRLLPDGRIGRMAVLRPWRGQGIGSAILTTLLTIARESGLAEVRLHAQTHALAFYAKHGFIAAGAEFIEAGISHRTMSLVLRA